MSQMTFRMMMNSGVLRSSDREIRRGPGGVPLYAMNPLPDFVNHSLDVLFGPEQAPPLRKHPETVKQHQAGISAPPQQASTGLSLKSLLLRLGLIDETKGERGREPASPQLLVVRLEERIRTLELLLKAERSLCQAQRDELEKLRSQTKRIDALEADLATERESGKQLVHWLLEAEQELARIHVVFSKLEPVRLDDKTPLP
jgi:hypothetical protein